MTLAVVILAGGDGARMGGDKPLRLLSGRSLMDHMIDHARKYSATVAISLRHQGQFAVPDDVAIIEDREGEGPVAGLMAAGRFAQDAGCDRVLTLPCDTPFVPDDLVERLSAALSPVHNAALAMSGGRLHPVCGLWRSDALAQAEMVPGGALRHFAAQLGYAIAEWNAEPFDPFLNINHQDDLVIAERLCRTN